MPQVFDVLRIAASFVSLAPFLSNLIAPSDTKDDTSVRIVLGSSVDGAASFSENTPEVPLWDFNSSAIGFTDGTCYILPQGNFVDIAVEPFGAAGNIQAAYISLSNGGNDVICTAVLSVTFPDGAVAGFSTNVAAACGAFWSNINTPVLEDPASAEINYSNVSGSIEMALTVFHIKAWEFVSPVSEVPTRIGGFDDSEQ
ncbi:uncharacterized protein Z519_09955 [Cladophialophora bantiana CBS 173.52]|uniref:Uncharacterized protein n=1 Tax=Cladophialophora bantiana (strain ATCC 10958 / CBS 173.52 / CDC B-1940 / NIH 8579) TaxID=1442370 RepID=A0A0D2H741_CLAB1|nr:uncharacterized protein Z519_09955 [Cladophialophora bantiana CBS 173.52]KIW89103.1 hypothetical protein Z519_09955 [Cladophialophora bantiana CBS 173.52]